MKYIDAEKLIAEIKRLRNECAKSIGDGFVEGDFPKTMSSGGAAWVCEQLLSFIDSLQQEQTEVDLDLEKEIDEKYRNDNDTLKNREQYARLARHFYELGCRHAAVLYDDMERERQRRCEKDTIERAVEWLCTHHPFDTKEQAQLYAAAFKKAMEQEEG